MPTTEMTSDALDTVAAAAARADDQPIFMLNLLRYNDQADYADGAGFPPCSGPEAYSSATSPPSASWRRGPASSRSGSAT